MRKMSYYGHGKLLLSGEYLVMDGAKAFATPTQKGQYLHVTLRRSHDPKLYWKSYGLDKKIWAEFVFDLWRFNILKGDGELAQGLAEILKQARSQNVHFLREQMDIIVETVLEFPRSWGLGSSSTLIYNIAQWAYIGPFELGSKTFGGSGYDLACAQSEGPIFFQKRDSGPTWRDVDFNPPFLDHLYFLYTGQKVSTSEAIDYYQTLNHSDLVKKQAVSEISTLTDHMLSCVDFSEFQQIIAEHEMIMSEFLKLERIQNFFAGFWGQIKSLGAWGGDFALVCSDQGLSETRNFFKQRGLDTLIPYREMILDNNINNMPVNNAAKSEYGHVIH